MHIEQNVDLTPFNTLALPGQAARYQKITSQAQLTASSLATEKRFILGGGSNLVLTGDFDGLVLHMAIPGRELAAVYVPTTPNPTSGYLEVVPVELLTPTDWTVDQAMGFIISGGAVAPETMPFTRSRER